MKQEVKNRAKAIYRQYIPYLLIAAAVYTIRDSFVSGMDNGMIMSAVSSLLSAALSASSACFWFRTYNRGSYDYSDMYTMFTDRRNLHTMLTIMLIQWVINVALVVITLLAAGIPVVNLVVILLVLLVAMLLSIVWYLHVANPAYSGGDCVRASWKYMNTHLADYIPFVIGISIIPVLVDICASLFFAFSPRLSAVVSDIVDVAFRPYIALATAGYVANIIPDEWYSGTATI